MARAAIYVRVSQDSKGENLAVDRQEEACRTLAERNGWEVVEVYSDNDISAMSGKQRPAYRRLLADLEAKNIDAVVTYAWDRLMRRMRDLVEFIDIQQQAKFEIAQVTGGDVDLTTAGGRRHAFIMGSIAQGEAETMGERIKFEQVQAAKEGRKHQGPHRVFGYERDGTIIKEEETVVREIFKRRAKGESATAIAVDLNERGIPTVKSVVKSGKSKGKTIGGGTWDASRLVRLIQRRDYIAEVTINGEVIGTAKWDPIIDRPTFELANQNVEEKKRDRGSNARVSLLAGFLVCGNDNCFTKMKSGKTKDGPVYRCPGQTVVGSCGSCSITGGKTDEYVFNAAWRKEQDLYFKNELTTKKEPTRDYNAEIAAVQGEIDQLKELREAERISLGDYVDELDRLRKKIAKVQREQAADTQNDFGIMQLLVDWEEWNLSQQRLWLDQYIDYVVVSKADPSLPKKGYKPERLEVHYKDGTSERLRRGVVVDTFPKPAIEDAPVCAEEGCARAIYAKGLCQTHYKAAWRRAKRAQAK